MIIYWASEVVPMVEDPPAMQVQSLGQEDPLEKEMVTHSSFLALEISWTEEPSRLQSIGPQGVGTDWVTNSIVD